MQSLGRNLFLVWHYGKVLLILGALFNVCCTLLLSFAFSYALFLTAFVLKVPYTAVVLYLFRTFGDRDAVFFYINLGMSRKRLLTATLGIDFAALAVLLTVVAICQ